MAGAEFHGGPRPEGLVAERGRAEGRHAHCHTRLHEWMVGRNHRRLEVERAGLELAFQMALEEGEDVFVGMVLV